jgi:hypothetical protein
MPRKTKTAILLLLQDGGPTIDLTFRNKNYF